MSKDDLHTFAQNDTPSQIEIPNTWHGLIVWAVGRFGIGVVFTGLLAYGIAVVYQDGRKDQTQLLDAYNNNTEVMSRVSVTIEQMSKQVDRNTEYRIKNQ